MKARLKKLRKAKAIDKVGQEFHIILQLVLGMETIEGQR